jgi:hypothetical protein
MANVIGEPLDGYLAGQINARQFVNGSGANSNRTDNEINLLTSNTSWVKLGSGISVSTARLDDIGLKSEYSEGMDLAKDNILFGGTSKLENQKTIQREGFLPRQSNSSYTYDKSFGFSPMAGIESVDVKTLNRGSLKKATVKLKANDRSQFDIIELLYLRLGYTVLLEWGNAFYTPDGIKKEIIHNTLMEEMFFKKVSKGSYLDMLDPIEQKRADSFGNYDALFGKISNFQWSFNPDGTYDIELTIISLGDVIESLKSNISPSLEMISFLGIVIVPPTSGSSSTPSSGINIIEDNKDANIISSMLFTWKYIDDYNRISGIRGNPINIVPAVSSSPTGFKLGNFLKPTQGSSTSITGASHTYEFHVTWTTSEYSTVGFRSLPTPTPGTTTFSTSTPPTTYIRTTYHKNTDPTAPAYNGTRGPIKQTFTQLEIDTNPDIIQNFHNKVIADWKALVPPSSLFSLRVRRSVTTISSTIDNPIAYAPLKSAFVLDTKSPEYYIKFGYLLEYISNNITPRIDIGPTHDNNPKMFDIDYDEWDNHMYSLPNQFSLDPRVCIVRNSNFVTNGGNTDIFHELRLFREIDNGVSGNTNAAYPMNIYLNFKFVLESLKPDSRGDVSIFELISNICTGVNKALGGINNLEPVIDENSNTLKIIDTTPIPGYSGNPSQTPYILQIYGYDKTGTQYNSNFVRNFDLKTAITPEYATMITIGATAGGYVKGTEATAFSKWNDGLRDRYKEDFTPGDSSTALQRTVTPDEAEVNYVTKISSGGGYSSRYGLNGLSGGSLKLVDDLIASNISIGTEYYKYLLSQNNGENSGGTVGFIPFKMSIKIDGISGIRIYNKLQVNTEFLPKAYGKYMDLIVTGISHRLSNNDWETSIETTAMPKTGKQSIITIPTSAIATTTPPTPTPPPSRRRRRESSRTYEAVTTGERTITSGWPMHARQYSKRHSTKTQIYLHHDASYQRSDDGAGCADILYKGDVSCHVIICVDGHQERMITDEQISYCQGSVTPAVRGAIWPNATGLSVELQGLGYERDSVDFNRYQGHPLVKCVDWRGNVINKYKHKRYQEYSNAQMISLKKLLKFWMNKHNIPFKYNQATYNHMFPPAGTNSAAVAKGKPGIWTHNSVEKGKSDVFPSPKLIKMLTELSNEINP